MPTHTLTRARTAYLVIEPTHHDAIQLAAAAAGLGCRIHAHPDTIRALHAAVVVYGPMVRRTTLAAVLDVDVVPDPGLPAGLVVLAE
jgi:hypothetical protein